MNDRFLIQLAILSLLFLLSVLGYRLVRRTKEKTRKTYVGSAAKSMSSLFSPHQSYMKEMEGMIVNEVYRTEPRDDDNQNY